MSHLPTSEETFPSVLMVECHFHTVEVEGELSGLKNAGQVKGQHEAADECTGPRQSWCRPDVRQPSDLMTLEL